MRRRFLLYLTAIVVLIAIVHTIWWRVVLSQLESGLAAWQAQARQLGWTLTTGRIDTGGWPWAGALILHDATLQGRADAVASGITWSSTTTTLAVGLFSPGTLTIAPSGPQSLRTGRNPPVAFSAETMRATVPVQAEDARSLRVSVTALQADLPDAAGANGLRIGTLQAQSTPRPASGAEKEGTDLFLSAEGIDLPASVKWPLGRRVSSVSLEGTLTGLIPQSRNPAAAAASWRDAGGALAIRSFMLGWGPLGVSGSATLALDDQLQPMGAGTAHVVGYAQALDALASSGRMTRSAATAATAVLSLLARGTGDNEPGDVDVPLVLQYRTLSMRQVPLVRLPELDWPAP